MATFGKSDKNSRDLHIGYGTNYPLELTQPIGPGPGECFSLPNVKHRSSPEYSMRGRPNARLAMDRSPAPRSTPCLSTCSERARRRRRARASATRGDSPRECSVARTLNSSLTQWALSRSST